MHVENFDPAIFYLEKVELADIVIFEGNRSEYVYEVKSRKFSEIGIIPDVK